MDKRVGGKMGDINNGLVESFKKGFNAIRNLSFKTLEKDMTIQFKHKGEEVKIRLEIGSVVINCDDSLLKKWIQLIYIVDQEYTRDKNSDVIKKIDEFLESFN